MAGLGLRELAEETGMDASQLSKIERRQSGASAETMRKLELYFTQRGFEFRQFNGTVCICCPDHVGDMDMMASGTDEITDEHATVASFPPPAPQPRRRKKGNDQ